MKFLSYFLFDWKILKPILRKNSQQCALLQPLCPPSVYVPLCTSLSLSTQQWHSKAAIQSRDCRHCTSYSSTKLQRVTNGCRTWRLRFSLDEQLGNNVLLFNCVNQISANGKKGKTPQKLTKQKEQDDRAFRLKLPGASEISYGWWWK